MIELTAASNYDLVAELQRRKVIQRSTTLVTTINPDAGLEDEAFLSAVESAAGKSIAKTILENELYIIKALPSLSPDRAEFELMVLILDPNSVKANGPHN